MARLRTNDPLGVSDTPTVVTDPAREQEIVTEFQRRLRYVQHSFCVGQKIMGNKKQLNDAIKRLKDGIGGTSDSDTLARIPPLVEMVISYHARRIAAERTGSDDAEVMGEDIKRASRIAADKLEPISHRPTADVLRHHVEGLMALLQETSGKPVLVGKTRNSVEDSHFKSGVSELIPKVFRELDPTISVTQLVNIILAARRKYAGKPMRFIDFFPGYGATMAEDGSLLIGGGRLVAEVFPNLPTYYP